MSGHRVDIHSGAYHVSKHGSVGVGKWVSLGSAEEESLLGVLFAACILSMVVIRVWTWVSIHGGNLQGSIAPHLSPRQSIP